MAVFRPFRAFRPLPDYQAMIPAPPYDVLTAAGARERAAGNSLSFLHVDKAEIDLPPETDPYSPAVYEKARENLLALEHTGALVQDPKFEEHFTNARNAGLRVGIYCFSQAVNENEAREEAQACVYVLNGRQLDYPIYFDTEASGAGNGRADGLGVTDRTKCAVAFCEEVKALGYKPGVYASTTWFRKRLDMSQLSNYYIWNAHYNVASSPIACNMWQGTCTARIPGYGGQIDVNISYMG